jgi:hypothetical protein
MLSSPLLHIFPLSSLSVHPLNDFSYFRLQRKPFLGILPNAAAKSRLLGKQMKLVSHLPRQVFAVTPGRLRELNE